MVSVAEDFLKEEPRYAKLHKDSTEDQQQQVWWSHESKFEQVINMCRKGQERSRGIFMINHGGDSVMVWGCISASGFGDPVKSDGIMNTVK